MGYDYNSSTTTGEGNGNESSTTVIVPTTVTHHRLRSLSATDIPCQLRPLYRLRPQLIDYGYRQPRSRIIDYGHTSYGYESSTSVSNGHHSFATAIVPATATNHRLQSLSAPFTNHMLRALYRLRPPLIDYGYTSSTTVIIPATATNHRLRSHTTDYGHYTAHDQHSSTTVRMRTRGDIAAWQHPIRDVRWCALESRM